jgi:hypothetical protein
MACPPSARALELTRDGIVYRADRAEWLRAAATAVSEVRGRLFFYFGAVPDSGLEVFIASDRTQFLSKVGPAFPDWGIGAAAPRRRLVVLLAPGAVQAAQSFAQVAQHEYAHIFLHLWAGPQAALPRWLDEGFAMHAAFEWSLGRHLRLARASLLGGLLSLRELEGVNRFGGEKAALAYTQSFAAYQFLERRYGREGVRELIAWLSRGRSLEQAFAGAFGTGYAEFQAALNRDIAQRHDMWSLITDSGFLWASLGLLIVLGWYLKRRRARAVERRWRIEDRIEGEIDFNEYVDPDDDESWRRGS